MLRLACFATAVGLAGCGLIDPDIADIDLSLPEKDVTIDSSQWGLPAEAELPALPCDADATVCDMAVSDTCDPLVATWSVRRRGGRLCEHL